LGSTVFRIENIFLLSPSQFVQRVRILGTKLVWCFAANLIEMTRARIIQ
jgi:hypothetical protein